MARWEIKVPFRHKNRLYRGQGLGLKFSSRRVKDGQQYSNLPTSLPFCSTTSQSGKGWGGSLVITQAPTTGWKLTNHHKTYLSVQCNMLCNCCSSVPITYQCLMTLVVYLSFVGLALECFSCVKTQMKHLGTSHPWCQTCLLYRRFTGKMAVKTVNINPPLRPSNNIQTTKVNKSF